MMAEKHHHQCNCGCNHDHNKSNGYFGNLIAKHTGTGKPEEKPYDPVADNKITKITIRFIMVMVTTTITLMVMLFSHHLFMSWFNIFFKDLKSSFLKNSCFFLDVCCYSFINAIYENFYFLFQH